MNSDDESKEQECRLSGCLYFTTAKLARELGRIADEAFIKTGLSPSHALLLYMVNLHGVIQQKEIGEALHLTPSTITRLIEKLERKNLVTKKSEGKNAALSATEEGMAIQEEIITSWNKVQATYKDLLTEEEARTFLQISSKLLNKLDEK